MTERDFWIQVRRGLLMVVAAIENRYRLPRGSTFTIGAAPPQEAPQDSQEPPPPSVRSNS